MYEYKGTPADSPMQLMEYFKGYINSVANDWMRSSSEFEDLQQAGYVAVWLAFKVPFLRQRRPESFYKQRIWWGIRDEARKLRCEPVHISLDAIGEVEDPSSS